MKPLARHIDLPCTETGGELVFRDHHHNEIHRLSALVAVVYRHADGHTSVTEMVALARKHLKRAVSREMIFSSLDQLSEAGLLMPPPSSASRRIVVPVELLASEASG